MNNRVNDKVVARSRRLQEVLEDIPEIESDEYAPAFPTLESDAGADSAYESFSIGRYDD